MVESHLERNQSGSAPKGRRPVPAVASLAVIAAVAAFVAGAIAALTLLGQSRNATRGAATRHYIANEGGNFATPHALGYNLHDIGSDKSTIDKLPGNDQAVVWLGEKCPSGLSTRLKGAVASLGRDSKVFAYYLSDEPHVASCPQAPKNLAAETAYIRAHTKHQLSFIVLLDRGQDYSALAPPSSHVDLIGLDPYPCNLRLGGCDFDHIDEQVRAAEAAGINRSQIVPVFQLFGDSFYLMPDPDQLRADLNEWAKLVPKPRFDYSYSWGCQNGSLSECLRMNPEDQTVMAARDGAG